MAPSFTEFLKPLHHDKVVWMKRLERFAGPYSKDQGLAWNFGIWKGLNNLRLSAESFRWIIKIDSKNKYNRLFENKQKQL